MQAHQFKMHEIEWSSYLLGFRSNIFLEADPEIQKGDIIILSEVIYVSAKETGRSLAFKIKDIDRQAGVNEGKIFWAISLERLKEYNINEALKRIEAQSDKEE